MLINANALSIPLAAKSVHTVVTSPPYYGTTAVLWYNECMNNNNGRFKKGEHRSPSTELEFWVNERGTDWYCPLKIWYFDGKLIECAVVTGMNFMGDPEKTHENALVVGEFWHEDDCVRVDISDKFNEQVYKEQ